MKADFTFFALPPVIVGARLGRLPRAARCKTKNNYLAERHLSAGINSGNRKGAGARPGNRNAVSNGAYTAHQRAFLAYERSLRRRVKVLLALRALALAAREAAQ